MATYCRRPIDIAGRAADALPSVVDSADDALAVITHAMCRPPKPEVIVLVLDSDWRGHAVVIVDGTESPDAVIEVVELLAEGSAEAQRPVTFVVASVRPVDGPLPGDADRWLELCEIAELHGCEIAEWFVLDGEVAWCPRDLLAERPRWPGVP
jgi:hypothetical protein